MRDASHMSYKLAMGLLVVGIFSLIAVFPLSFLFWGKPFGLLIVIAFFSGLIAIVAATALGLFNYLSLHGNRANDSQMEKN